MQSIDDFKQFVRTMPLLKDEVLKGTYTWQQLYELYDMYGKDHAIWNEYQISTTSTVEEPIHRNQTDNNQIQGLDLATIMKYVQNIDLDKASNSLNQIQKVITMATTLLKKEEPARRTRPTYRRFDD